METCLQNLNSKCLQIIAALFASPIEVVCAWLDASQSLDEPLYPGPEAEHFQGVVEPARGDAEIRLVGGYVVNAVVSAREDHVIVLEERDHPREAAVRVRPLVDLVGESDEDPEHEEEGVDVVPRSNLFVGLVVHDVGHAHQRGQRDEAVVPVGFYEVVSGNGQRVHVVLTKRSDECLWVWQERERE